MIMQDRIICEGRTKTMPLRLKVYLLTMFSFIAVAYLLAVNIA